MTALIVAALVVACIIVAFQIGVAVGRIVPRPTETAGQDERIRDEIEEMIAG